MGNGRASTINQTDTNRNPSQSPTQNQDPSKLEEDGEEEQEEELDIYEVLRAAWLLRVPRLEEFAARYIAYRLEDFIDDPVFASLVAESARRIKGRQETDTVELVDDIRYFLSERFRLRFEDSGFKEMMEEEEEEEEEEEDQEGEEEEQDVYDGDDEREEGEEMKKTEEERVKRAFVAAPDPEDQLGADMVIRTLDGEIAGDEFQQDAINYQILLGKIDTLLENLDLDA